MGCILLILILVSAAYFGVWPVLGLILLISASLWLIGIFCD